MKSKKAKVIETPTSEVKKISLSLSAKIAIGVAFIIIFSTTAMGIISYFTFKEESITASSNKALAIATSVATGIDGEQMKEIFAKAEKNDYWYEKKEYLDKIKKATKVEYLYVLDSNIKDEVVYFVEGNIEGDTELLDFLDVEDLEAHNINYYEQVKGDGLSRATEIYSSGEFGMMLSGIAPVKDDAGNVCGIVGVDIKMQDALANSNRFGIVMLFIVVAFSIIFTLFIFWYVNKNVGKPVKKVIRASNKIAKGDMDVDFKANSKDEIGQLFNSFQLMADSNKEQVAVFDALANGDISKDVVARCDNDTMSFTMQKMIDSLNDMFNEINNGSKQVSLCAEKILNGSTALAQGSTEQAAAAEELSVTIAGVALKAENNAKNAGEATVITSNIKEMVEVGSFQMNRMIEAVEEIDSASRSVINVIKIIEDIAFKTNILAINAAVEAAHAGEFGKGFAVVADEVRSLAAQSSKAAQETAVMIEESIKKVELGAGIASQTAQSLEEIVQGIKESSKMVDEIAEFSEEQRVAISQINIGIEQVAQIVNLNSKTAEESAIASEVLSKQSDNLWKAISKFNLKKKNI